MTATAVYREFLAEHLPYELAMMRYTISRLSSPGPDWNAFVESFCVHARNLKQFVTNEKGKGNNSVVARDFTKSFHEKCPSALMGAFQRLNAQMAHLAKTRSTDMTQKFTIDDARAILAWLEKALCKFRESLVLEDRNHWGSAFRGAPTTICQGHGQFATNAFGATQSSTSLFAEMTVIDFGTK
jgi:hypothetical protein